MTLVGQKCLGRSKGVMKRGFGTAGFPIWLANDASVLDSSWGGVVEACVKAGKAACNAILFSRLTGA